MGSNLVYLSFVCRFLVIISILYGPLFSMEFGEYTKLCDLRNACNLGIPNPDEPASLTIDLENLDPDEPASLIIDLENFDTASLKGSFYKLPTDFYKYLLQFFDGKDIVSFSRVNHYYEFICHSDKMAYFQSLPALEKPEKNIASIENYLRKYVLAERFVHSAFLNKNRNGEESSDFKNNFYNKNYENMHNVLCQAQKLSYSPQFRFGRGPEYREEIVGRHEDLQVHLKSIDNSLKQSFVDLTTHDDIWKHGQSLYNSLPYSIPDPTNPITCAILVFKILLIFLIDISWV